MVYVSEEKAADFRRCTVRAGDLVFTCWGTVNQVGLVDHRARYKEYVISNKQMKLTPDPAKAESLFLYYLFSGPEKQSEILGSIIGSSVPGFNLGQLKAHRLRLPPVEEQKEIASVLGALDDKIELNRRMNATLEALAQAVFKEWFVDGAKEVWDEKTIGDLIQLIMGQSPKGDTYNDQGEGLPLLNGAGDFTAGFPEASRYTSDPLRTSKEGDIVFTMRGTIGNLCIGDREYALGRCVSALKPKESFMKWLIYFTLERGLDQLRSQAMGSVITGLTKEDINRVPVRVPDKDTAKRFHDIVDPLMIRREHNRNESRTLAALRDTLLPKLMRGEVRVRAVEQITSPTP